MDEIWYNKIRKFKFVSLIAGMKMLGYIESYIIITLIYFIVYKIYLKKKEKKYIIKFSIMYIYLFLVLCVTILPIDFTNSNSIPL